MINRNEFKQLMGIVELTQNSISEEIKVYDELFEDFDGIPKRLAKVEDALVNTLQEIMDTDWIEWYVYDAFMGTVPLTAMVDGQEVLIDDLDKLYDIIMKESDAN